MNAGSWIRAVGSCLPGGRQSPLDLVGPPWQSATHQTGAVLGDLDHVLDPDPDSLVREVQTRLDSHDHSLLEAAPGRGWIMHIQTDMMPESVRQVSFNTAGSQFAQCPPRNRLQAIRFAPIELHAGACRRHRGALRPEHRVVEAPLVIIELAPTGTVSGDVGRRSACTLPQRSISSNSPSLITERLRL